MKKGFISPIMVCLWAAWALAGCRKAPDASADREVYHAKSSLESQLESIRAEPGETEPGETQPAEGESGGSVDALVGTEENGVWIRAELPKVPLTMPTLMLRQRDDWDEDKLRELLGGEEGKVRDITAEYLAEREKELSEMAEEDKPGQWMKFGDDSLLIFSDGQREASFAGNTSASYVDQLLKEKCQAIYKRAPEIEVMGDSEAPSEKFPVSRAEEILLEKLAVLDIGEISVFESFYYELDGTAFYELSFTPSYDGVGVASEFGGVKVGEVRPRGTGWITEDGVAAMSLTDYCGLITERSGSEKILTFSQVTAILEKYLENNRVLGVPRAMLTQAELVYYPALRESELILTPSWHIYIPLKEMMESLESGDEAWQEAAEKGGVWNIYLDAVTGKLLKAE